jgi:hypothetical protein
MDSSNYDKINPQEGLEGWSTVRGRGCRRGRTSPCRRYATSRQHHPMKRIKASKETCSSTGKQREACMRPCLPGRRACDLAVLWKVSFGHPTDSKKENPELIFVHELPGKVLSFPNFIKSCLILIMHANLRPLAALHVVCFVFACTNHFRWDDHRELLANTCAVSPADTRLLKRDSTSIM